jgi:hypothetical protein
VVFFLSFGEVGDGWGLGGTSPKTRLLQGTNIHGKYVCVQLINSATLKEVLCMQMLDIESNYL